MYCPDDTIVAVATPPGRGGIGVVRLAGPDAPRLAARLVGRSEPFEPRHATFAKLVDRRGAIVDQVVLTWFAAPHSYTGDDVVEISGHGSPVLMRTIVELAMSGGARLAEPGEFTLRAYLNGRIDLIQAEAVADLVDAVTPLQARAAMDQLEGTLTVAIRRIDAALFDVIARLEASLDFPEEGFHFITRDEARSELDRVRQRLAALAAEGRTGRVVREGRLVAIVGPPNAGKSSLFNALAGADRAIVTDVPGTTRDLVTERVDVEGVPVTLVDTAGLREAGDAIEAEGVARAQQAQGVAALTLVVLDRSRPLTADDRAIVAASPATRLVVANKADRPAAWTAQDLDQAIDADGAAGLQTGGSPRGGWPAGLKAGCSEEHPEAAAAQTGVANVGTQTISVSALTGDGLADLRDAIARSLTGRVDARDPPALSNVRHIALVETALAAIDRGVTACAASASEEVVLAELAEARQALEEITGRRAPDDLLRHIFGRFCIGK